MAQARCARASIKTQLRATTFGTQRAPKSDGRAFAARTTAAPPPRCSCYQQLVRQSVRATPNHSLGHRISPRPLPPLRFLFGICHGRHAVRRTATPRGLISGPPPRRRSTCVAPSRDLGDLRGLPVVATPVPIGDQGLFELENGAYKS